MVALVLSGATDPAVTLCVKAQHLRSHAGEVALPGGRLEPDDPDPLAAALRELREETQIQLPPSATLGHLDQHYSLHGLRVTPFVLWSEQPVIGKPDDCEIAAVFQCPFRVFFEPPVAYDRSARRGGVVMPRWHVDGHSVWGLTALILNNLTSLIGSLDPESVHSIQTRP